MRLHKLKASDKTGTYLVDSPVTENDILQMAKQLASLRLCKGRALTSPKEVFSHLQALLADYEHEVFALLMLDSRHRVIAFEELFRGTLDGTSVYPREVVKLALEHNAAALILVHNHPSGDPEARMADRNLTTKLQDALNLVGVRTLDHNVVGDEGCVSLAELGYLCRRPYEATATHVRSRAHVCRDLGWLPDDNAASDFDGALSAAAGCSSTCVLDP